MTQVHPLWTGTLGLLLALAFSGMAMRWLAPLGWMDHPDSRKQHSHPIPRSGGLALWATLCLGQLAGLLNLPITPQEWLCLHGLALLGALDDRFSLSSRIKAMVGLGLALTLAIPVAHAFAVDRPLAVLMGIPIPTSPPFLIITLLTLWFWAVPQTFNLIDGMDGLAIGTSIIVLLALQLDFKSGQGVFLFGAVGGIFLLNWPKAFHFLGDCGAYLLGGLLALVALKTKAFIHPSHALWIFAYPILDTLQVIIIRLATHRPLGMGDRNHLHHHWARLLGRYSRWAVPILWVQMIALATRPLHFLGSGWIAGCSLILVLGQIFFFSRWAAQNTCPPASHP